MVFEERLNELGVVNPRIIQDQHDAILGIVFDDLRQKLEEFFGILWGRVTAEDFATFIIQSAQKFVTPVLPKGRDHLLLTFRKPGALDGLVVANHRFILKEDAINIAIQQVLTLPVEDLAEGRLLLRIGFCQRIGGACARESQTVEEVTHPRSETVTPNRF